MRQTAVGEPEVLVEPPGVDLQHIACPFSHRTAVIERIIVIAADLAGMAAAVEVDDAVIGVSPANQHENALPFTVFDELDAVRQLKLAWSARRFAVQIRRIVLQKPALAVPIQGERPRLHRRHLRRVSDVGSSPHWSIFTLAPASMSTVDVGYAQ